MSDLSQQLIDQGVASAADVHDAAHSRRATGVSLALTLTRRGAVAESDMLRFLSQTIGLPLLAPESAPTLQAVRAAMSSDAGSFAWLAEHEAIAWRDASGGLNIAGPRLCEPSLQEAIEQWRREPIQLHLASALLVEPILLALRGDTAATAGFDTDPSRLMELAEEAPVIDFVNAIFSEALAQRASDVHIEPFEQKMIVRMRVDGVLSQRRATGREMFDAVASRIKLLSGMDIAERRLPQDGRQTIAVAGRTIDVRVSSLPTAWGESIVVRLLGHSRAIPELDELGLTPGQQSTLLQAITQPNGLVLISGPTGSGKTTTVYRLLTHLNDGVRKIVTIEDPVEFDLPGVLQMSAKPDIGLDFATALRSVLRQDPDVIFVGEIRDAETAQTAVRAALTGHLVISTVHTNSALATVPRLVDLGVERFLLADVLRALVGQRLARRPCPSCEQPDSGAFAQRHALEAFGLQPPAGEAKWRRTTGCSACAKTGFRGRIGLFEVAPIDEPLQLAIRNGAADADLLKLASATGFMTLNETGYAAAQAGLTTYREVMRIVGAGAA
jgi:general secretion pathway protein E